MTGTVIKDKILREDFNLYAGKTTEATRLDSTAGTLTGTAVGDAVDILAVYGGDRTNATIQNAVTQLGTNEVTISFTPGTWTIADDVTIPNTISCYVPNGVTFDIASGKTLTIVGPVKSDSDAVSTGSGTFTAYDFNDTVQTIAALRLIKVPDYAVAKTIIAYSSAGDGGGGDFYWDATSTATDDGGAFILPTGHTGAGRWIRTIYGEANVRGWGAKGDGVTDDSAAIQACVDAAENESWAVVIPPAEADYYSVETPIYVPPSAKIRGSGKAGEIRNTVSSPANVEAGAAILFGNSHPEFLDQLTYFSCSAASAGDTVLTVSAFTGSVGDTVIVRSDDYYLVSTYTIYSFYQLNIVTAVTGSTVTLRYPLAEDITAPYVAKTTDANVTDSLGNSHRIGRDIVVENLAIASDDGVAFARGGLINCSLHFSHIESKTAISQNIVGYSKITVDRAEYREKLFDIAGGSHDSTFEITSADYIGVPADGQTQMKWGQNARDCQAIIGSVRTSYSGGNGGIRYTAVRKCRTNVGSFVCTSMTGSLVMFEDLSKTSPETSPVCQDNLCGVRRMKAGSGVSRFALFTNADSGCNRNLLSVQRATGTVATSAVTIEGEGHQILDGSRFEDGSLLFGTTPSGCIIRGYFEDGITDNNDTLKENDVRITDKNSATAIAGSGTYTAVTSITDTSAVDLVDTGDLPAAFWVVGVKTPYVEFFIEGRFTGTTDNKYLILNDQSGDLITITEAGGPIFRWKGRISFPGAASYYCSADYQENNGNPTISYVSRTSLNLNTLVTRFKLQCYVANASDSISLTRAEMRLFRGKGQIEVY